MVCDHHYVTHMIQMPQGYSKPVSTRCDKCGDMKGYDNRVNGGTMNPYDQMQARTTAQLSAQERSKLTDAIIAQVGELTKANNKLHARQQVMLLRIGTVESTAEIRLDAIDRRAAVLNTSFLARLRWLLTGR